MTIFLGTEGLTSTSANFIANMAKEAYLKLEGELEKLSFTNETVELAFNGQTLSTKVGTTSADLNKIEPIINEMARLKSLIAWLREAIKERDRMTEEILNKSRNEFVDFPEPPNKPEFQMDVPEEPQSPKVWCSDAILNTWDIARRVRYESLKTKVSNLGKLIHNDGIINKARQRAVNSLANPHRVEGTGRDLAVYSVTSSVSTDEVDALFFELQAHHREFQKELNVMMHELETTAQEWNRQARQAFNAEYQEYEKQLDAYNIAFNKFEAEWYQKRQTFRAETHRLENVAETLRQEALQKIQALKIVIPENLKDIYEQVACLGKKK